VVKAAGQLQRQAVELSREVGGRFQVARAA